MNIEKITYLKVFRYLAMGKLRRPIKDKSQYKKEPYAFIRVKNEIKTIKACLDSISPVIRRGVIAYQKLSENEKDDGTLEVIEQFIKDNPGYVLAYYPYEVYPPSSPKYSDPSNLPPIENRLDGYYNFALSHIPDGEWLIKIDCDQIYNTEKLRGLCNIPLKKDELVSIARLNLHYMDGKLYYIKTPEPLFDPVDHWLIYKNDLSFEFKCNDNPQYTYGFEYLNLGRRKKIYTDLISIHFPYLKSYKNVSEVELIPFNEFKYKHSVRLFYKLDDEFMSEQNIMSIVKNFKL